MKNITLKVWKTASAPVNNVYMEREIIKLLVQEFNSLNCLSLTRQNDIRLL